MATSPSNSTTTPEVEINALRQYPFPAGAAASYNLHHHQPPPYMPVIHAECLKNHAIGLGGYALDGCGDFMPSSTASGDPASLICAACGCHRSFHRRRELEEHYRYPHFAPPITAPHYISLRHPAGRSSASSSPPPPPLPHRMILSLGGGAGEQQVPSHHFYTAAPPLTPSTGKSRKRFRTKFTKLQKEKMHLFAESMEWKIGKCNHVAVENFCREIGVTKSVLKVWMHNHKKKDFVRKVSGGGDAAENDGGENVSTAGTNGSEDGTSSPST